MSQSADLYIIRKEPSRARRLAVLLREVIASLGYEWETRPSISGVRPASMKRICMAWCAGIKAKRSVRWIWRGAACTPFEAAQKGCSWQSSISRCPKAGVSPRLAQAACPLYARGCKGLM